MKKVLIFIFVVCASSFTGIYIFKDLINSVESIELISKSFLIVCVSTFFVSSMNRWAVPALFPKKIPKPSYLTNIANFFFGMGAVVFSYQLGVDLDIDFEKYVPSYDLINDANLQVVSLFFCMIGVLAYFFYAIIYGANKEINKLNKSLTPEMKNKIRLKIKRSVRVLKRRDILVDMLEYGKQNVNNGFVLQELKSHLENVLGYVEVDVNMAVALYFNENFKQHSSDNSKAVLSSEGYFRLLQYKDSKSAKIYSLIAIVISIILAVSTIIFSLNYKSTIKIEKQQYDLIIDNLKKASP